jgi:D-threonate/D-erythronate kinase
VLRLLADDLTGALDAGAPFARPERPVPVVWHPLVGPTREGPVAVDVETRETPEVAGPRFAHLAPILRDGAPAFLKIDSRLRGSPAVELAACLRTGGFASCVLAPAFPDQGRITRAGRQLVRDAAGGWQDCGRDLRAELAAHGLAIRHARQPAAVAGEGILLCDAESVADLAGIVAAGRRLRPPVLWCGTSGLAHALAGPVAPLEAGAVLAPSVLVLVGTDHPASTAQLDQLVRSTGLPQVDAPAAKAVERVHGHLREQGRAALRLALPPGTPRAEARRTLYELGEALAALPAPGSAIVTGGDTLLALCQGVAARDLALLGELLPGVSVSRLRGGPWNGTGVVAKSGGFGGPDLLLGLLSPSRTEKAP